jgi:PilZ domain
MAVRKKAKRPARKATRKSRKSRAARKVTRRKAPKVAKRTARKRVARRAPAASASKPAPAIQFVDDGAAPRCRSRIPVEIEVGGRLERGAIADMSASGARIVGVPLDLPPGTPLRIRYASGSSPILLAAELVRQTADGFAVKILPR